nr:lactate racemase domain-containing protein [uncultured Sphaerochaeta sp.]
MLYCAEQQLEGEITLNQLDAVIKKVVKSLSAERQLRKVLVIPPDYTRFHSRSGQITSKLYKLLGNAITMVLPALGTHYKMTDEEKSSMFKGVPLSLFHDHDHKTEVVRLGSIGSDEIARISKGAVSFDWPIEVSRLLVEEQWDLIISIGQVVPHEVAGMSNYTKNTLVGVGGKECIDKSHYVGAICNMETIMGQVHNPVRDLLNLGSDRFLSHLPIVYIQTVVAPDMKGGTILKGVFASDDVQSYERAAALAQKVNIFLLDRRPKKVVVLLDENEYKSTWVGNKSIYRARLAIADGGELIILAPGLHTFGENPCADSFIRTYGYRGIEYIKQCIENDPELANNLGSASHLIHGSTEGRFSIRYCPGNLNKEEIEQVGFSYGSLSEYASRYNPATLCDGWNNVDGEEIFYISNPGLGLWAYKEKFEAK